MGVGESEVVDGRGQTIALSAFLTRMLKGSDLGISEIARRSHLSRSFLYLLMDDQQVPSIDSLVAVFEAAGCDDVRAAFPGEPGDIGLHWQGQDYWVRLPHTGNRATRSRNSLRTLSGTSGSPDQPLFGSPTSVSPHAAAAYDMSPEGAAPSVVSDRQRLLGDLLEEAGALDEGQLQLLVEHARLMRRS